MIRYSIYLLLLTGLLSACSKEESAFGDGTLGKYIAELGLPTQRDSLIACAASGQHGILKDNFNNDISIIFYPPTGAMNYRYYELATPAAGTIDLRDFKLKELNHVPLLNGYLRKFVGNIADKLCLVTFVKDSKLFISDPITIKGTSQPTTFNPSGTNIFNASSLSPSFNWNPTATRIDKIYFQIIADADGDLISGTYTESTNFTFYDLSNVVLNIRDITPPPTLTADQEYQFVMMGVSDDNWVNVLVDTTFTTN